MSDAVSHELFQIHKGPRGEHARRDAKPTVWQEPADGIGNGNGTAQDCCCLICNIHQARYTCPACSTRYCSKDCYQRHSEDCTERFYKTRVSGVLALETKERGRETRQLLNRIHKQQQQQQQQHALFSQEDLLNMLRVLESDNVQEIQRLLESSSIRASVDEKVREGQLQDWLLEPWHPWWRPEMHCVHEAPFDEHDQEGNGSVDSSFATDLDERILDEIPSFASLRRLNTSSQLPLPALQFNLIDLIYTSATTLRLYHGCANACQISAEASDTLIATSAVLSNDARFESLNEALVSITTTTVQKQLAQHADTLSIVADDVSRLCANGRHVAKALLEATDIVRAAIQRVKLTRDNARELKRTLKKIEFYLSWSRQVTTAEWSNLSESVHAWVADWRPPHAGVDELHDLVLPTVHGTKTTPCPIATTSRSLKAESAWLLRVSETQNEGSSFEADWS
jgi:hypothetical protein